MAAVTFIDSSAIGVLLRAYMLGIDLNVPLIIRNPSTRVNQVIDVLRLRNIFPVIPSLEDATASTLPLPAAGECHSRHDLPQPAPPAPVGAPKRS